MPQRKRIFFRAVLPLGLLAMAAAILGRRPDDWEYETADEEESVAVAPAAAGQAAPRRRPAGRFALAATFSTLFFAGAAFTAGAGDQAARLVEEDAATLEPAQPLEPSAEPEIAPDPAAEQAAAPEAAPEAAAPEAPAPDAVVVESMPAEEPVAVAAPSAEAAAPAPAAEAAPSDVAAEAAEAAAASVPSAAPAPSSVAPASVASRSARQAAASRPAPAVQPAPTKKWVVKRAAAPPAKAPEIEIEHGGEPTIWLNRALPDPTPASARLKRGFAKRLVATSRAHGADWAAVLGVLRAQGERGAVPASARELDALAARMAGKDTWKGALALSGRTGFADRAAALADLYRFVGVEALVNGYAASKQKLTRKVLSTPGVLVYSGGRSDMMMGRIDIRVVVLIGYLAERHGSVTVSSLFSGHRKYARPGVVSAHVYGHAVDIAAVGGTSIAGHQQPGGLTEAAVRSVLLLPGELQPQQVISLLGLGGPSFPLRDHGDHIHVGF